MSIFKFQYPEGGFRQFDLNSISRIDSIVVTEEIDDLKSLYLFKVEMKLRYHIGEGYSLMRSKSCMDFVTHEQNRQGIEKYITECRKLMSEWRGEQPRKS